MTNWYRGFALGMFAAGVMLGIGAILPLEHGGVITATTPTGVMIAEFVIAGMMAGLYMVFHDSV